MNIKQEISQVIEGALSVLNIHADGPLVNFSNKMDVADFQSNICFALAKKLGKNPLELATQIVSLCKKDGFEFSVCAPAFINIKLTDKKLSEVATSLLTDPFFGIEKTAAPKTIFFDYGGANVAKELHMGHLRSPIIGESLRRVYALFGHKTISDTHLGDWGLQMGLTIAQLEDDGLLDFYFKGKGEKPTITLDLLNTEYPKASVRKKTDENFKAKADLYTLNLQRKKEPFFTIWKEMRAVSIKAIERNYNNLNIHFDIWDGESSVSDLIAPTIELFKSKGLTRVSEGALVVDVATENENIPIPKKNESDPQLYRNPMPPAIIQKYNGGELYMTTDLATIWQRNTKFNPDEIIYVTDNRQTEHFIKLFRCAKMAGISPEGQRLTHVPFGTMNGKDGKPFKTRSGETIKLEDIIELIKSKAQEKLTANGLEKDDKLALEIGVAALKFGDLSNDVARDYVLDIDKFAAFEGKTGPYLQYTNARINSLLEKAGALYLASDGAFGALNTGKTETKSGAGEMAKSKVMIDINSAEEREIVINVIKLIDSFSAALVNLTLNGICNATFTLAQSFSAFYNNIRILSEPDAARKQALLAICALTQKGITFALDTLAIDSPRKM